MKTLLAVIVAMTIFFIPSVAAKLTNLSEISIVTTGGNTDLNVYTGKTLSKYVLGKNNFQFGGHITKGKSEGIDNASNWDINARYERSFQAKLGTFYSTQYENDRFAGIHYRFNNDLGLSYDITKTEKFMAKAELGYRRRTEKQITGGEELKQNQARIYLESSRQNTDTFFTKMWIEYLPNFTESGDWQLNVEPSMNFAMSSNLSVKLGYLHKYDNQPAVNLKKYDSQYTTTLIAKF